MTQINDTFASFIKDPALLAALHKAYAAPTPKSEDKPKAPKAPRAKGEKKAKEPVAPIKWVIGDDLTLHAQTADVAGYFLTALCRAGLVKVTNDRGVTVEVYDPIKGRADQKFAVALFAGWTDEPHGTQLDRAVLHARFLCTEQGNVWAEDMGYRSPIRRHAAWSVEGYIAGMPNALRKILADVAGRERTATEEYITMTRLVECQSDPIEFEKRLLTLAEDEPNLAAMIRNPPAPFETRAHLLDTLETLADARLDELQHDLAALYSGDLSADAIERAHAALVGRGAPTFEEGIVLMGTTPKN